MSGLVSIFIFTVLMLLVLWIPFYAPDKVDDWRRKLRYMPSITQQAIVFGLWLVAMTASAFLQWLALAHLSPFTWEQGSISMTALTSYGSLWLFLVVTSLIVTMKVVRR